MGVVGNRHGSGGVIDMGLWRRHGRGVDMGVVG